MRANRRDETILEYLAVVIPLGKPRARRSDTHHQRFRGLFTRRNEAAREAHYLLSRIDVRRGSTSQETAQDVLHYPTVAKVFRLRRRVDTHGHEELAVDVVTHGANGDLVGRGI